jgi:N-acetylglutamate synthase/N-acetylornithine aminotransferase
MTKTTVLLGALATALFTLSAAIAADDAVKPAPTPAPKAGPTVAAAEAFCGDTTAKAEELFTRYSSAKNLKQTYTSDQFVAYSDDEKNPTLVYTFTTKRHAAHPAAVCRKLVKEGDQAILRMVVVCDGEAGACANLKNDFNVMNAKMQVEVDQQITAGKK